MKYPEIYPGKQEQGQIVSETLNTKNSLSILSFLESKRSLSTKEPIKSTPAPLDEPEKSNSSLT